MPSIPEVRLSPVGRLVNLTETEIAAIQNHSQNGAHKILRKSMLAVLNTGAKTDDAREIFQQFSNFEVEVVRGKNGVDVILRNAPSAAFVDGEIIRGVREHIFAVLRDIVLAELLSKNIDLHTPHGPTDAVIQVLRKADLLDEELAKGIEGRVVCWGGHAISDEEYEYTKNIGYQLGLRGLEVITGCGAGAMKGPMKGANIGHEKQRIKGARHIGLTEPEIIISEPPNAMVDPLVILPDIEKRLEAFVRLGQTIVVFPGGVGTAEEIQYALGILMHPKNIDLHLPIILTGPQSSKAYFHQIDEFIGATLGIEAQKKYKILIEGEPIPFELKEESDPDRITSAFVAKIIKKRIKYIRTDRKINNESMHFNRGLFIPPIFQEPFLPLHQEIEKLQLTHNREIWELAADLRRAFSAIVGGNIKPAIMDSIGTKGLFKIRGESGIMKAMDKILHSFIAQKRMKIEGEYKPCYQLVEMGKVDE